MRLFTLVFLVILSSSVAAADNIESIKVTAVRIPVAVDQMAAAITIITDEELELQQIFFLADYLKTIPGVALAKSGSVGGQTQLRVRGAEANQTLVMIDGVEVNDPSTGDEFQWEHLTVNDIERVEIIRSPMSATWGSDAIAGVINVVTRKSDLPSTFVLFGDYGTFNTQNSGARLSKAGANWQLNFSLAHNSSDGTNVSRTGDEKDGYRNTTYSIGGALAVSSDTNLTMNARRTDASTEFDRIDWATGLPADSDSVTDVHKDHLSVGLQTMLFDGLLYQSLRLTRFKSDNDSFLAGTDNGSTDSVKTGFYVDSRFTLTPNHRLTLAVDHEDTEFTQRGVDSAFGDPNQKQSMRTTGYVVAYLGNVNQQTSVTASLRYDDSSVFDSFTSWQVGATYNFSTETQLFANVSRGQKSPTFIERFGYFPDQFVGNADLSPERALGYELGLKQKFGDTHLDLTFFKADLENEINGFVFDSQTFLFTATNMDEKSRRKGVEMTLNSFLTDDLQVKLSYTYLKATEGHHTAGTNRELRRPKHSGSLAIGYRPQDQISLSLAATYTGKANDLFFPPWPDPSQVVTLDSYWLVSAAASYQLSENLSIYTNIKNALDNDYEDVFGFSNPGLAASLGLRFRM